ncbi:MAG TPA: phytase, partial [Xanthomonadales bacterium]|nr:phytase [Xanthomonadales bacterium]
MNNARSLPYGPSLPMNAVLTGLLLVTALIGGCQAKQEPAKAEASPAFASLDETNQSASAAITEITAAAETEPTLMDGANALAIWLDPQDLSASRLLGASGEGGIEVYDLSGQRLGSDQRRAVTVLDVHYNFPLAGTTTSLVVAYDSGTSDLVAYTLDSASSSLEQVSGSSLVTDAEIEGLCFYHSPLTSKYYVFAAGDGYLQQWELYDHKGTVEGRLTRKLPVGLGAAQCAASDSSSTLYFSQETVGVWRMNPEPESEAVATLIDLAAPRGRFSGDVKGLALVEYVEGGGYLLVSDADASQLQVYSLADDSHVATLAVVAGSEVDGAEETEGLAATGLALNPAYPGGLLVVSDEDNADEHTNFKLLSWQDVAAAAGLTTGAGVDKRMVQDSGIFTVSASLETEPVKGFGDAADDPMIWVAQVDPAQSLVIGTQKKMGINVYNLEGQLVQSLADGRINNIDLRYNFPLGDGKIDVLTASNRSTDGISIYAVNPDSRQLYEIADGLLDTGMGDPYGLCMYRSAKTGNYYVIINDTDGVVKQWQLLDAGNQKVGVKLVREFKLDTQTEGCVADDETGDLYIGEEDVGIWKYSAEPDAGEARVAVDSVAGGNLTDDVEGLAIYFGPNGS